MGILRLEAGTKCASSIELSDVLWSAAAVLTAAGIIAVWGFGLPAIKYVVIMALLMVAARSDARFYIIPNEVVLALFVFWCVCFLVDCVGFLTESESVAGLVDFALTQVRAALLGGAVSAGPVVILTLLALWRGKQGMGGGDIKLLFAVGLLFPWEENIVGLLLACVAAIGIGAVWKICRGEQVLPFGCAIAVGWWAVMMFGQPLVMLLGF